LTERKDKESSAHRPLFRARRNIEFLGLPLKLFGELQQLSARRIVPRQALRQPQTGFGFIPEICRVHRASPCGTPPLARVSRVQRKREHASRRDEDHRLSRSRCHKIGSANAAAIPRLFVGMRRIASVNETGRQLRRPLLSTCFSLYGASSVDASSSCREGVVILRPRASRGRLKFIRRNQKFGHERPPFVGRFNVGRRSADFKVSHSRFQNRPLGSETGYYRQHNIEHIANREQIVYTPFIANCHRPAAEAAPSVPSESRS